MQIVNVIVETPKGSAQKYDFDPATGYIKLKKTMPAGTTFPFDFGFIEGTIGEDGDPLDAMVIAEATTFPGCAIDCRIVGAITASQQERDGATMRNDRFIAIPIVSDLYADVKEINDLPKKLLTDLEAFFTNYNRQAGKKFDVLSRIGSASALRLIEKASGQQAIKTKLIQLFLPTIAKNGKPFPRSYYDTVREQLTDKFNGVSMYFNSKVSGVWKDEDAKLVKDELMVFEVMSDAITLDFWKSYQRSLQKQFKQESILIRCMDMNLI
jgi:inorganic pyrophosphatase